MSRTEVFEDLKTLCSNVTQDYPDILVDYPCLIFSFEEVGQATHDGIGLYDQDLTVEVYSATSEERSVLERKVIEKMRQSGWVNLSNTDASNPDHYRNILRFERSD